MSSPHLGQADIPGTVNFQTLERLLSLRAFETFLFGTAMIYTSFASNSCKAYIPYLDFCIPVMLPDRSGMHSRHALFSPSSV
jgi:hypothetical protein